MLNRLLFIENTGFDLSELHQVVLDENPFQKEVEFISMDMNVIPEGRHYGYGELQMLEMGLKKSHLRQITTHMLKVTGRLTFPSIGALLDRLSEPFGVWVECRIPMSSYIKGLNPLKAVRDRTGAHMTTQLMIFSHAFYERELQHLYPRLQPAFPGSYPYLIESLLYDQVIKFEGNSGVPLRWPVNVEPSGHAGHTLKNYNSPKRTLTSAARAILRRIAPSLWF